MRIVGIEEERVGGLIAFQVEDPEGFALFDDVHPVVAGGDDFAVARGVGVKVALLDHVSALPQ